MKQILKIKILYKESFYYIRKNCKWKKALLNIINVKNKREFKKCIFDNKKKKYN